MRIEVGIGSRYLDSEDGGRTWRERPRDVLKGSPVVYGPLAAGGRLPDPPWTLTEIALEPGGLGIAAGFEKVGPEDFFNFKSMARFLRTRDGGRSWEAIRPALGWFGRFRAWPGWPPQSVDSVGARPGGLLAFGWDDPWLYEGPDSHLVVSSDGGTGWRYKRMPDSCTRIARGPGPLRVFGSGRIVTDEGGRFRSRPIRLHGDWPPGYYVGSILPREATFVSEREALGLEVAWRLDGLRPQIVGLARSEDGGISWEVLTFWEGPPQGDINERYMLSLDVGDS